MLQIIRFLSENICDCVLNNLSMNKINYMLQQKKTKNKQNNIFIAVVKSLTAYILSLIFPKF